MSNLCQKNAGALEITDANDYYPFGMNHLKTGNAFFGRGSYKDNKYNGKELQETGMYSYGWREYMPDIARWNGIDQLAEYYHMANPYAYVLNNPISFLDPDGRDVKPTSGGYEFSGSDLQNVMAYLQQDGSPRKLMSALSAWEDGNSGGGDFWGYFGSWNALGATGGDVGGSLYASTWGDGAMGATVYDIQEIVFTRTKIADVESLSDWQKQLNLGWLQPGHAQMIGGAGDFLGIFDIGGQVLSTWKPENRYLAMAGGILAAVSLRKPGLATVELQAEGKIIGLGIDADLALHRGTGAITWKEAQWQKAGLTNVDWAKALIDKYHFRSSFREAAENATGIRFEVSSFNPFHPKPKMTNFEFDHILSNPGLLQKTTFIKNGNQVIWDGTQFITK